MQSSDAASACNNAIRFLETVKIHQNHFTTTGIRINRLTAQSFTPFDYIFFDENMSSRVLCDLLSPRGKHGQGDLFLQSFLAQFTPLSYSKGHCHAQCEYNTRNGRRIDIALYWQEHMLAIENKLWAGDQRWQLADYLEEISRRSNYYLLYLTRSGQKPDNYTLPADKEKQYVNKYGYISWREVIDWLMQTRMHVEAAKLRFFIEDFCNQIRASLNYGGTE